jgi:hypothetical protein
MYADSEKYYRYRKLTYHAIKNGKEHSMSLRHGTSECLIWNRKPLGMEGNYEYAESIVDRL